MASLVTLVCGCTDSLKSILTSQDFGSEYEILCTELSVQWLRIRLWGQSVGLHIDGAHHLHRSILNRPEIETTVTQTVNSIAFLLAEIEILRRRYELRPRLIPESPEDEKARRDSKPHSGLFRPAKHLHQRMKDNQKQKSFLALAKWGVCDAKRFHEKVSRLKTLIDGLEDISKAAAGINQFQLSPQNVTSQVPVSPNENPPPYSIEPPQQAQPIQARIEQNAVQDPVVDPAATRQSSMQDPELFQQYISLKKYAASLQTIAPARLRALEKLSTLLDGQFKELRVDVYDELCRRREARTPPPSLSPVHTYHVKRNMAREKLSTLTWYRFAHLVTDVVLELERRFSSLENGTERVSQPIIAPDVLTRTFSRCNPRHGAVLPSISPPALLSERASHPATLNRNNITTGWPLQSSRQTRTSITPGPASGPGSSDLNIENSLVVAPPTSLRSFPSFKSFRVSMDDPTYKVLPAVMKKYGIDAPWDQYLLYVNYGTTERRLELDEKPLVLFNALKQAGHKPCFMLRKLPATIKEGITVR